MYKLRRSSGESADSAYVEVKLVESIIKAEIRDDGQSRDARLKSYKAALKRLSELEKLLTKLYTRI